MSLGMCKIFLVLYFITLLEPSWSILNGTTASDWVMIHGDKYQLDYTANYPYIIEILKKKLHLCGGVLIRKNIVLTVARCISMNSIVPDLKDYSLLAGNQIRSENWPDFVQTRSVEKAILHPGWPTKLSQDLAVLKTSSHFDLTDFVKPISVAVKFDDAENANVFGWGFTEKKIYSNYLKFAETWLLNSSTCPGLSEGVEHFCLVGDFNRTPCYGDFGGPLVFFGNSKEEDELMGLFAFNWGAREPGNPSRVNCEYDKWGTGVNITYFQDFIKSSITTLTSP